MLIGLDMDGTIVDFVGGALELFGVPRGHRKRVMSWDGIPAVISKHLGREVPDAELWATIDAAGEEFWATLQWLPWGPWLYNECAKAGDVALVTTPTRSASSAIGKLQWIRDSLPDGQHRRCYLTKEKTDLVGSGALLIDDGQHNIAAYEVAGGRTCMIPAPWNDAGFWPSRHAVQALVRGALAKAAGG